MSPSNAVFAQPDFWRLRRCGILEFDLARAQTPILRRSLTELRKLQTERHARILQMPDGQVPSDLGLTAQSFDAKRAAIGAAIRRTVAQERGGI
jgi:hypothetical protein